MRALVIEKRVQNLKRLTACSSDSTGGLCLVVVRPVYVYLR
jgi:hypothetical protein